MELIVVSTESLTDIALAELVKHEDADIWFAAQTEQARRAKLQAIDVTYEEVV